MIKGILIGEWLKLQLQIVKYDFTELIIMANHDPSDI